MPARHHALPPQGFPLARMIAFAVAAILMGVLLWLGMSSPKPASSPEAASSSTANTNGARVVPAAPAIGTASMYGIVEDAHHAAISGATVCARAGEALPTCTTSDEGGQWSIVALRADRYALSAAAPSGFATIGGDTADVRLADGEARGPIALTLVAGTRIVGRVHDVDGTGVPGLTVVLSNDVGEWMTKSGADGAFEASLPNGRADVEVATDGYFAESKSFDVPGAAVDVTVHVESVVVGHVVDATTGAPVANAIVSASGSRADGSAVTDASGAFRIGRLAAGTIQVSARAPGLYGVTPPVVVSYGQSSEDVVVGVGPAANVTARVAMEGGNAPCRGGTVSVFDARSDHEIEAPIDDDGIVHFDGVPRGAYEAWIHCETGHVASSPQFEVAANDVSLTWTVSPDATIEGVAVDEAGALLAGAIVEGGCNHDWHSTTTGIDGRFRLAVSGGGDCAVDLAGVDMTGISVNVVAPAVAEVRLVRPADAPIDGVVVDEKGAPVAGVVVSADPANATAATDADGHFVLRGVRATSEATLTVRIDGFPLQSADPGGKTVFTAQGGDHVRLVVAHATGVIEGVVVDGDGSPLAGVELLSSRPASSEFASAWSDERGHFTLRGVSRDAFNVLAKYDGAMVSASTLGSDGLVHVVFDVPTRVAGVVTTADGAAVHDLALTVTSGDGRTYTFASNQFSMPVRAHGAISFDVKAREGHATAECTTDCDHLAIVVDAYATLRGVVVAYDTRAPIAGAEVSCGDAWTKTAADGGFTLANLRSEHVSLYVSLADDRESYDFDYGAKFGETTEIVIPMPRPRVKEGESGGDLGFEYSWTSHGEEGLVGANVDSVEAGSPAAAAGLAAGDKILAIEGVPTSSAGICDTLLYAPAGTEIHLTTTRGPIVFAVAPARNDVYGAINGDAPDVEEPATGESEDDEEDEEP